MRLTKDVAKELVFEAALFAYGVGATAWCYERPVLLTLLWVVAVVPALAVWRGWSAVRLFVLGAIVGPTAEAIAVSAGAWAYAHPSFLGIPLWLPLGWGVVVLLIKGIADTMGKMMSA